MGWGVMRGAEAPRLRVHRLSTRMASGSCGVRASPLRRGRWRLRRARSSKLGLLGCAHRTGVIEVGALRPLPEELLFAHACRAVE